MKKIKFCLAFLLLVSILIVIYFEFISPRVKYPTLHIHKSLVTYETATTEDEMERGLSHRIALGKDHGMLFSFVDGRNKRPTFWMKNMLFPIDIIWINKGKVVGVSEFVSPSPPGVETKLYHAPDNVDYVLEVNAGWAHDNEVSSGATVEF